MRAFCVAIIFLVVVAVIGAFSLGYFQESSSTAYSSATGARLDRAEAVNNYGRQVIPD
jgi:hypothetical protein